MELAQDLLAVVYDKGIVGATKWVEKLRKRKERQRRQDSRLDGVVETVKDEEGF